MSALLDACQMKCLPPSAHQNISHRPSVWGDHLQRGGIENTTNLCFLYIRQQWVCEIWLHKPVTRNLFLRIFFSDLTTGMRETWHQVGGGGWLASFVIRFPVTRFSTRLKILHAGPFNLLVWIYFCQKPDEDLTTSSRRGTELFAF